jgi:SAM-dependent methyltransferase
MFSSLFWKLRLLFHDRQETRDRVRRLRRRIADDLKAGSVLEIGCGLGAMAAYLPGDYLGVEPDPRALAEARERFPEKRFLAGSLAEARAEIARYDAVLFCAVLHEIDNREELLRELAEAGARRIVIVDYSPRLTGWLKLWLRIFEPAAVRSYWTFDPTSCFPDAFWQVRQDYLTAALIRWDFTAR